MDATGSVKWFDNRKGFGFLRMDGIDEDIFVHYSNVVGDGFRCLHDGEVVDFVLEQGDRGYHAFEVRRRGPCPRGGHPLPSAEPVSQHS